MVTRYKYDGWIFEMSYDDFYPVKFPGQPYVKMDDKFYAMIRKFDSFTEEKQKKYEIEIPETVRVLDPPQEHPVSPEMRKNGWQDSCYTEFYDETL